MASDSGRRKPLRLDLANASPLESPPGIAALFLIRFDIKTGYAVIPELQVHPHGSPRLTEIQCTQICNCLETVFA